MATNQYININFDEFENKTEFSHKSTASLPSAQMLGIFYTRFGLRRIKTADFDALVLDCNSKLTDGILVKCIISYDGETKDMPFERHHIDIEASPTQMEYKERGIFRLADSEDSGKKILEDISRAETLKIRVYWENKVRQDDFQSLLSHFREFYSDVYESDEFREKISAYQQNPQSSGCFIATAAMGSEFHPDVLLLRQFRDEWLLGGRFKKAGQVFVKTYYQYSPPIANFISTNETLRAITRWCIVRPLRLVANILLKQKN